MVTFQKYQLPAEIKKELEKLQIDFVFQPIFHRDGKTIYAYEALMRPETMTIME